MKLIFLEYIHRCRTLVCKAKKLDDDLEAEMTMLARLMGVSKEQEKWMEDYLGEWITSNGLQDVKDLKVRRQHISNALSDLYEAMVTLDVKSLSL